MCEAVKASKPAACPVPNNGSCGAERETPRMAVSHWKYMSKLGTWVDEVSFQTRWTDRCLRFNFAATAFAKP
jgi:hypothetical protein